VACVFKPGNEYEHIDRFVTTISNGRLTIALSNANFDDVLFVRIT